jgi:tripartite-type tricarboxylate transporter receptor subunit TctC
MNFSKKKEIFKAPGFTGEQIEDLEKYGTRGSQAATNNRQSRKEAIIMKKLIILLLTVGFAIVTVSGPAMAREPYYRGKKIEVLIPTSAGGSTDKCGRLFAEGFRKFLKGKPTVVPRNMTGAGGLLATNWLKEKGPKDGTALLTLTGQTALRMLLGSKGARAEVTDFEPLAGQPACRIVVIRAGKGVKTLADIKNLKKGPPLYTAMVSPISGISFILESEMAEIPLKVIPGYKGGKERDLAMLRGEIDIYYQVSTKYKSSIEPLVKRGGIVLWTHGLMGTEGTTIRETGLPDIRTFPEAYKEIYGKDPSGPLWDAYLAVIPLIGNAGKCIAIPREAPQEAKDAIMDAVKTMSADPEFSKVIRKRTKGYDFLYGAELDAALTKARDIKPEQISYLKKFLSSRFEIEFAK